jgi:integrase
MKAHLTERYVKGLQPKQKNIIVYDEEVVGFGVRITSGGKSGQGFRAFILTYRIEARERHLTIGAWPDWSVTAAREEAKRLKREIDQGRDPMAERDEARESPNVRQLINRYLEEHAAKLAKRNRDDQASMLRKLVEPAWGPRNAAEIQPDDVDRLLRQIAGGTPGKRGRKPTPVRANRLGEILRKMFNLAIRWRIRADNPAAGFARNAEAPRDRYLSTDEIGRLSGALDAHPNRPAAALLRTIRLRVPEDCEWVFPGDAEGKPLQDIKRFWEDVRAKADLPAVRIHDLRHTFASLLVSGGMTLPMIGKLLGHTQVQTTQRYAHLLDDPLRAGLEQVGDMLRAKPKLGQQVRI